MNKPKIVATASHTGGINAITNVVKSMKKDGLEVAVINSNPDFSPVFQRNNLEYDLLESYNINDSSIDSANKLISTLNPGDIKLILLGQACQSEKNKNILEQSLAIAAREYNIPTLSVSDFWTNRPQYFSDIFDEENGKFKFLTTKIAILDPIQEGILLKQGFPKDKLEITGNPYFDNYKNMTEELFAWKKYEIMQKLNISRDDKVVLFASQPIEKYHGSSSKNKDFLGYTQFSVLANIADVIDNLNDMLETPKTKLLVKLHREENLEDFSIKNKCVEFIDKDFNLIDAMLVSDVVTSMYSTVLVESTFLDKPSLSIQTGFFKQEDLLPTNDLGITVPVYSNKNLRETLKKSLFNKNYQKHLKDGRDKLVNDGLATQRVKDLAYRMMKN
ncbi:MAG TPA: CDP-glycerol glycerophosphotransferase family protein [Alphaproteobacteria bacterium]|nr:CDP-glycerol glycerophosphotransferase family protein [Alphaproteobacteria bacterium]